MRILRVVVANRDLARLESVWACVSLVRWALAILVALYAYREAGPSGVGSAALFRMLPAAALAPRLSMLADRRPRRLVLVLSLVVRAALTFGMGVVVWNDGSLLALLVLAALFGLADSLQKPTQAALLGVHARNPTELAAANTLWSMLDNAGFVLGSVLVGVVVALAGLTEGLLVCVVPLVAASAVAWRLTPDLPATPLPGSSRAAEALAGVRAVAGDRRLRLLVAILAADMFVQAAVDVLLVVAALGVLGMGEQGAGWLSAAWGLGGVAGGAAAAALLARRRLGAGLMVGLVLGGVPLVAIGLWPQQALALALMTLLGVGFGVVEVVLLTLTQRLVAADVLGRVYGVQETLTAAAMALGAVAASALVVLFGEEGALVLAGVVLPAVALLALRGARGLDHGAVAPDEVFEALRGVPAFASLPMATLETLAVRATHERVEADRDVVRQGDVGDTFYVITGGAVGVFEGESFKRVQGAGEFFGEIALLHRVSRTATVRTIVPTELLMLGHEEFLAAVGAHPRTRHVLHDVASDRLAPADVEPG